MEEVNYLTKMSACVVGVWSTSCSEYPYYEQVIFCFIM